MEYLHPVIPAQAGISYLQSPPVLFMSEKYQKLPRGQQTHSHSAVAHQIAVFISVQTVLPPRTPHFVLNFIKCSLDTKNKKVSDSLYSRGYSR